jgi:hypothetical protein
MNTEPRPPPGGYIEPNTHFYSNAAYEIIIDRITCFFAISRLEFRYSRYQFKFSVGKKNNFHINIFSSTNAGKGKYIIEFQRRSGDAIVSGTIYNILNHTMNN